ncbi:hypothetical protein Trydic_g15734 [Trypoxylus dichotomus]
MENNNGPNMEPCGTPERLVAHGDVLRNNSPKLLLAEVKRQTSLKSHREFIEERRRRPGCSRCPRFEASQPVIKTSSKLRTEFKIGAGLGESRSSRYRRVQPHALFSR